LPHNEGATFFDNAPPVVVSKPVGQNVLNLAGHIFAPSEWTDEERERFLAKSVPKSGCC